MRIYSLFILIAFINFGCKEEPKSEFSNCASKYRQSLIPGHLNCENKGLKKIPYIDELSGVTWLSVPSNKLKNLDGIINYHNLEILDVSDNNISNIEGIENLHQLKMLNLLDNPIKSIKNICVNKPHLHAISLSGEFSDLSELNNCKNINELHIENGNIYAFFGIYNLSKSLDVLMVKNHPIENIDYLNDFKYLRNIVLTGTKITNINGLEPLKRVETLALQNNIFLTDVSAIFAMKNLRFVNLTNSHNIPCWQIDKISRKGIKKIKLPEKCQR
jgi:Leucine-rich repeat (LRR) protein